MCPRYHFLIAVFRMLAMGTRAATLSTTAHCSLLTAHCKKKASHNERLDNVSEDNLNFEPTKINLVRY